MTASLHRRTLFSQSQRLVRPLSFPEGLPEVRVRFSELFDRAAAAVFSAGFDLDDVIVERRLTLRVNDSTEHETPADFLSDAALLEAGIRSSLTQYGWNSADIQRLSLTTISLAAYLDQR
jgi:hypothetical protein